MGPNWLVRPREKWPKCEVINKSSTVSEEERKSAALLVGVRQPASVSNVTKLGEFLTAERLFRVTACVVRFGFNTRAKARGTDTRV